MTMIVVVMIVVVVVMIVVVTIVVVIVGVPVAAGVAARLGLEGPFEHLGVESQLMHQAIEHVVVLVRKPPGLDLQRHVPIAQVVRGARQQVAISRLDDRQQLWSGAHLDHQLAVARRQTIAVFQRQAALEQEAHLTPAVQTRSQSRSAAQLENQRQRFFRRPRVACAQHYFEHLHRFLHQNKK
ncbi:MAG TPA: hypothetical protein VNG33_07735 [Polyangiaceae bacterium]|nr:hypothetical protein [Polyangiaceae bacterium]